MNNIAVRISVVIPAHNRPDQLLLTLDAVRKQTLPREEYEVIVVDDGSTPPLDSILQGKVDDEVGLFHFYRQNPARGPAAARNIGIRHARGEFIAFMDDDCIPKPNWLEKLLQGYTDRSIAGVQGRIVIPAPERRSPELAHVIALTRPAGYRTGNISYRRAVLTAVGGFDERYKIPYRDDTDLGFAVITRGYKIGYAADAIVFHPVMHLPFWWYLRQTRRVIYDILLARKYPELYRTNCGGVFPRLYLVALVVAGLTLAAGFLRQTALASLFLALLALVLGRVIYWRCDSYQPTLRELVEIVCNSLFIPFAYLYYWIVGQLIFRSVRPVHSKIS